MKVTSIIFLLFIFLCIISTANGFAQIVGLIKQIVSVGQFIYSMYQKITAKPDKIEPVYKKPQIIYTNLIKNTEVLEALNDIPEKINLINQVEILYDKFGDIEKAFIRAIKMYQDIFENRRSEDPIRYETLQRDYEKTLLDSMWDIRNKITNDESASRVTRDFKTALVVS